jgi:hypothetical protein
MGPKYSIGRWKHVPDKNGFMTFLAADKTIVGGCGCCQSPFGCSEDRGHTYYNPCEEDRANAALIESAPDADLIIRHLSEWIKDGSISSSLMIGSVQEDKTVDLQSLGNAVQEYLARVDNPKTKRNS